MGRVLAPWRRLRNSSRLTAVRLVSQTSKSLAFALTVDVLAMALLPNLVLVAMGTMVGRVPRAVADGLGSPAGHSLLVAFGVVGLLFVLSMLAGPFHTALSSIVKVRLTHAMQSRLMRAVSDPPSIAHLEDPAVLNQVAIARGSLMDFWPADAPSVLALLWSYRLIWISACVILGVFRWWLGLVILVLWPALRSPLIKIIKDHVAAFGGNADIMRRAFYFEGLATKPDAAKEIRIFGLADWVVGRFRTNWLAGMENVWKIRAGIYRVVGKSAALVLVIYVAACGYIAWSAERGQIGLRDVAVLLPMLAMTMIYGSITFEDISIEWMTASLVAFETTIETLTRREVHLVGEREPSGARTQGVRFDSVAFQYPGSENHVFENLTLEIPSGRSLAIVGANGAGKTTLVKLLARLHDPMRGTITADGHDIRSFVPESWQRQVAVVFQDFTRYPVSARDNVAFGAPQALGDHDGVAAAAQRAGAREFIERLPNGWDTLLARQYTDGTDLSGGQWQRVALARALNAARHGASVLVLDEPTSWMDVRGEAEFFERFLEITEGLTTIIISHRFSTVRLADRIAVLEGGRVAEEGSHAELLERKGLYERMFTLQAARFADDPETPELDEVVP